MTSDKWLLKNVKYTHRYPSCWRCKTELVWKVTDEWYIAMDKPSRSAKAGKSKQVSIASTLRQRMIEVAKKIHWIPAFGLDRELDWLNNLQDWLISKKRRLKKLQSKAGGRFREKARTNRSLIR